MRHHRRSLLVLLACFISLQAADFCLTWALLAGGVRGDVYEANPLANRILGRFGWVGLAGFKSACSLVALSAILIVWRARAVAGARLLALLCLVMGGVVGYSGALLAAPEPHDDPALSALTSESRSLSDSLVAVASLHNERSALCRDLLDERIALPAAVERMRACLARHAPALRSRNRGDLPDHDDDGAVAGYLFHHATRLYLRDPGAAPRLARLADRTSERYPAAPLLDARVMNPNARPTFRTTGGATQVFVGAGG